MVQQAIAVLGRMPPWILGSSPRMTEVGGVPFRRLHLQLYNRILGQRSTALHGAPLSFPPLPSSSGLTRGSTFGASAEFLVKIAPIRIELLDQFDLPVSIPTLQRFLTLDRSTNTYVFFVPGQASAAVTARKTFRQALAMFINSLLKIRRHADVKRSAFAACNDVDIPAECCVPTVDPRVTRGSMPHALIEQL